MVHVWSGFEKGLAFSIRAQQLRDKWGFEVAFPVRLKQDRLDVAVLLDAISELPSAIPKCNRLFVDGLPFVGEGYGVVELGDTTPIFTSSAREDAKTVLEFANDAHPARYTIVPVSPKEQSSWIVAGPRSGPYISWLAVMSSEDAARHQAAAWSTEVGVPFSVMRQLEP